MKQNVGLSALIIAALAVVMRPGAPGPPADQTAPSAKSAPKSGSGASPPTSEILEGPWLATRSFFLKADDPDQDLINGTHGLKTPSTVQACVNAPADCPEYVGGLSEFFGIPAPAHNVRFLIATVPDPLHSRLSLFTDAAIQAIEEGADASGWIFATQWLPWIDAADPEEKDPDKRRQQRQAIRTQEKQPGILVFHRRVSPKEQKSEDDLLLIFLVGETPTGGVNPAQFQLAREYTRAIQEPADQVLILGPTFSGSFYSLKNLLAEDHGAHRYKVRSGTVTGSEEGEALQHVPGVSFFSTTANTADHDRYLRKALQDLRIDPAHAALLVEDESLFGARSAAQSVKKDTGGPIRVLRFPRDISDLRNAYRDAVSTSSKSGSTPPPEIEFSIKDPEKGEDSIPIFSGAQSPLSQYGVVNKITGAIRREGIELVEVTATNVLDMLFLADILKRQCPDTRLLLNNPDVLLIQAAQNEPLNGALILTSYPGFFAANEWMGTAQKLSPVTFPDANSEGVYNAAVLLLNDTDAEAAQHLADYHWRELNHPPTWLLTLDREGFLPVDVFPHTPEEEKAETWFQMVEPQDDGTPPTAVNPALPLPPWTWRFVSALVAFCCLALCMWIRWISSHPKSELDGRLSTCGIELACGPENPGRRRHLFAFLVVLFLMEIAFAIPGIRATQPTRFILLLAAGALGIWWSARRLLLDLRPDAKEKRILQMIGGGAAIFCLLWIAASWYWDDKSLFFAFRARELRFGSSPTWPVIASLCTLALYSFLHLTRYYLATCQKPEIVNSGISVALDARLCEAWNDFNDALEGKRGMWFTSRTQDATGPATVMLACVVAGVLFRVDRLVWSIDGLRYNQLAAGLQFLVTALLLLTCLHIRSLWRSLQSLLASLGMLPLLRSFAPVARSGGDRPIWVRRLNLQSVDVHIQAIYVLHNINLLAKEAVVADPSDARPLREIAILSDEYIEQLRTLLHIDPFRLRCHTLDLKTAMRATNTVIATKTFELLHNFWAASPLASPDVAEDAASAGDSKPGPLIQMATLAEKFVALHYSSFIIYGVRQIQNLLLFLPIGFVLLMTSLNCYDSQAPLFIGRMLLILFLLLGGAIMFCLVGLEKDPVLSRMAGSDPGKLNSGFYLKLAAYGALPVLSLLASQFPSVSNFLLSWVQPSLEAFK